MSSWAAYKIQFDAIVRANGWNKEQAMTALIVGLRDQALSVLEALGKDVSYDTLIEVLERRYGDAHLEHVYRAQLKDRVQRREETLQEWALEVERMVRKAYQSAPELVDTLLVQEFISGIQDPEVKSIVTLGHHQTLKNALVHALEVEAVRKDHRCEHIRELKVTTPTYYNRATPKCSPTYYNRGAPKCYHCHVRGHLSRNCPKSNRTPDVRVERDGWWRKPVTEERVSTRTVEQGLAGSDKATKVLVTSSWQAKDGNADAVARRPSEEDRPYEEETKETIPIKMLKTDLSDKWKETIQAAQQKDADIKPILNWMESGATKPTWSDVAGMSVVTKGLWTQWNSLVIHEDVLCRKWENAHGNHCHLQMIVPKVKVPDVLRLYHEGYSEGHLGVKRTLLKIRERFYWINCRDDVEEWVKKCTSCASVKGSHIRSKMNDINEHIRDSGRQSSEKMKSRYDRTPNNSGFSEGSLVWLHNPVHSKGKSPKLQAKWDGPYRVVTKINDITFRIQKGQRGGPKIVHVDRLARYHGDNGARDEHV